MGFPNLSSKSPFGGFLVLVFYPSTSKIAHFGKPCSKLTLRYSEVWSQEQKKL